jgi:hypothetical protein
VPFLGRLPLVNLLKLPDHVGFFFVGKVLQPFQRGTQLRQESRQFNRGLCPGTLLRHGAQQVLHGEAFLEVGVHHENDPLKHVVVDLLNFLTDPRMRPAYPIHGVPVAANLQQIAVGPRGEKKFPSLQTH